MLAAAAGGAGGRLVPAVGLVILASGASWLSASNLLVAPDQVLWPRAVIVVGTALTLSSVNAAALRGDCPPAAGRRRVRVQPVPQPGREFRHYAGHRGRRAAPPAHASARLTEAHLDALKPAVASWLRRAAARFLPGPAAGDPVTADVLAFKSLDDLRQQQAQGMAYFDTLLLCGGRGGRVDPARPPARRRATCSRAGFVRLECRDPEW